MSKKRRLKKQHQQRDDWVKNLEDLYLREEDEAFLKEARLHFQDFDSQSVADLYNQVVDRALTKALTVGDPDRVGALLAHLRHKAKSRPLVLLAEAVDLLAKGQCTSAMDRLGALRDSNKTELGAVHHLPRMLRALAQPDDETMLESRADVPPSPLWREIEDMAHLSQTLEAHAVTGATLPRSLEFADPLMNAVWNFYRSLAAVGNRKFRPGAKTLAALREAVRNLRSQSPTDTSVQRLVRETRKYLLALETLHKLEQGMRRWRRGANLEERLLERLNDGERNFFTSFLSEDPPPPLRPLQQALRTRWHDVLTLISDQRRPLALATIFAARPELLEVHLETNANQEEAGRWAEAQTLLKLERFEKLATFLRAASTRVNTAERLASLWSLELWAQHQEHWAWEGSSSTHQILLRLMRMATALDDRFDAGEGKEVARFLRAELLTLCDTLFFCDHFLAAAEALLEHLENDASLLVIALAGAVCSGDRRACRRNTERIAARGVARGHRESLLSLVENIAKEKAAHAVSIFTALKPLFADLDWLVVLDRVEGIAAEHLREGVIETFNLAFEDPEEAAWILRMIHRDLNLYQPLLGERAEFAALEIALLASDNDPSSVEHHIGQFLLRFEGLEPALLLYGQSFELHMTASSPELAPSLVDAVIDRLDQRWPLWAPHLASLVAEATPKQLRQLRKKIRGFSRDKALDEEQREPLRKLYRIIGRLQSLTNQGSKFLPPLHLLLPELEPPEPRMPRSRNFNRNDDRQLKLFDME